MTAPLRAFRAELIKLRSVRAWVAGFAIAAVSIVGLGVAAATGIHVDCPDGPCPAPPTGPGGEAVDDRFAYVHQRLDGDGELIAHVASFTGIITYPPPDHDQIVTGLVPWAKAGLMIKDGTAPGAGYAAIMLTARHGVRMQHDFTGDRAGPSGASWLRLSRSGSTVTGYASEDGHHWSTVGTSTLSGRTVAIGFFVASPSDISRNRGAHGGSIVQARFTQATAAFDHVSRTGPWTFTDVGDDGMRTDWERLSQPAGFTEEKGRLTVSGSGDIAPAGNEAGPTLEFVLAGIVVALVAVIVVAVLFITGEQRTGLIRTTFAAMPRRGRLVAVKAAVIGGVTFVCGLVATAVAVPLASHLVDGYLLPTSVGTRVRIVVGAALLLSLAAILAYALGTVIRRGLLAVTAAIVLVLLPYLLATASLLPDGVADWVLRLTPAAGFAFKQVLPAYPQVLKPYTPAEGYFPLGPWAGLGVLALWALGLLALAAYRTRRADA